jgi:hypothetical protein
MEIARLPDGGVLSAGTEQKWNQLLIIAKTRHLQKWI